MKSSPAVRVLGAALGAALLQIVMITAFAWPSAHLAPRHVPIVVTGPAAGPVAERLAQARPGAFAITTRPDEAAARKALTDRDAYGAIVTAPSGVRVLTASAASPVVAQQLDALAQQFAAPKRDAAANAMPAVRDVVAADPDDPRGTGFGGMALPLIMSSIAGAALLTFTVRRVAWRAAGVLLFALLGGLGSAALAQSWMSLLPGPYLAIAGVMAFTIAAVTGTVAGLAAAVGRAGLGVGALTFLLVGNPLSAATSAPELLPRPWGEIGQYLPPGASATLLRSAAFFDGAGAARPLTVLAGWAVLGAVLLAVGAWRARAGRPAGAARAPEPALT
ncbi:hypothetical protein [Actinomadura verrucosospora]|uniref:Integral membrane protein n=1 Tax=Actinomadura verrucosospora TaxID=46165 RepID=A0A7D4A4Y3_ACTVE|nr:hypothetical protein [Actinomadura verrucosospora]QKG22625.1 hypothetical protein ACTIVE_4266 [Actinomadura verrucosospora]